MASRNKGHKGPKLTTRAMAHAEGVMNLLIHTLAPKSIRRPSLRRQIETLRRSTQRVIYKSGNRRIPNVMLEKAVNSVSGRVAHFI